MISIYILTLALSMLFGSNSYYLLTCKDTGGFAGTLFVVNVMAFILASSSAAIMTVIIALCLLH
ncbi:MAG TPA: hypothetical protein PK205_07115 [Promineifilum sp.]|nr:hypothetical protein [Promineifilum sp.]